MMWCNDCKQLVETEWQEESEGHSELDPIGRFYPSEEYDVEVCSECGSEDIEEPGYCEVCGEECEPGATLCFDCAEGIDYYLDGAISYILKQSNDNEPVMSLATKVRLYGIVADRADKRYEEIC